MRVTMVVWLLLTALLGCRPSADPGVHDDTEVGDSGDMDGLGDSADTADSADSSDSADTEDTGDACDDTVCDALDCPSDQQVMEDGACCPTCAEPLPECTDGDDCSNCVYVTAPVTVEDCYCVACSALPMSAEECNANQAAWDAVCPGFDDQEPCPVVRCINRAPPICDDGTCAVDPLACDTTDDCTLCLYANTPTSEAECECPTCGTPMLASQCDVNESAALDWCIEVHDACDPTPCAQPPEVVCDTETSRCVFDASDR